MFCFVFPCLATLTAMSRWLEQKLLNQTPPNRHWGCSFLSSSTTAVSEVSVICFCFFLFSLLLLLLSHFCFKNVFVCWGEVDPYRWRFCSLWMCALTYKNAILCASEFWLNFVTKRLVKTYRGREVAGAFGNVESLFQHLIKKHLNTLLAFISH